MNSPFTSKYLMQAGVFLMLMAVLAQAYLLLVPAKYQTFVHWHLFAIFAFISLLSHGLLGWQSSKNGHQFVLVYMTYLTLKLIGFLTIILAVSVKRPDMALGFGATFLFYYFFFTLFEVIQLVKHLNKSNHS